MPKGHLNLRLLCGSRAEMDGSWLSWTPLLYFFYISTESLVDCVFIGDENQQNGKSAFDETIKPIVLHPFHIGNRHLAWFYSFKWQTAGW